jgi:PHD-finger
VPARYGRTSSNFAANQSCGTLGAPPPDTDLLLVHTIAWRTLQEFQLALPPRPHLHGGVSAVTVLNCVQTHESLLMDIAAARDRNPALTLRTHGELVHRGRHARVYCICGQPDDPNRLWIQCDMCNGWFHTDCVGLDARCASDVEAIEHWYCGECAKARSRDSHSAENFV